MKKLIVLKAVLLSRKVNKRKSKEDDIEYFNKFSEYDLLEYINNFYSNEGCWYFKEETVVVDM